MIDQALQEYADLKGIDIDELDTWISEHTGWGPEEIDEVLEHARQFSFDDNAFDNMMSAADDLGYEYEL